MIIIKKVCLSAAAAMLLLAAFPGFAQPECDQIRTSCLDYCHYGPGMEVQSGFKCKHQCQKQVDQCRRGMRGYRGYGYGGAPEYGYGAPPAAPYVQTVPQARPPVPPAVQTAPAAPQASAPVAAAPPAQPAPRAAVPAYPSVRYGALGYGAARGYQPPQDTPRGGYGGPGYAYPYGAP